METQSLTQALFDQIDHAQPLLMPYEGEILQVQTDEELEAKIRSEGITFPVSAISALDLDQIYDLSNKLIVKVNQIAVTAGKRPDRSVMDMLGGGDNNGIRHELDHAAMLGMLFPELLSKATITAVFLEGRNIGITFVFIYPAVKMTTLQQALINLAPHDPSREDYQGIWETAKRYKLTADDFQIIQNFLTFKPDSPEKQALIRSIQSYIEG